MDFKTKNIEFLKIIQDQKREIDTYKSKLRDLVAAHKGLLKEKAALEATLNALNANHDDPTEEENSNVNQLEDGKQLAAVISSLATMTQEKARVEALFQEDIKRLREEKEALEGKISLLEKQLIENGLEIENFKSLLSTEKRERDREQADHGAVMKELQNLMASERSMRVRLEQNLSEFSKRSSEVDLLKLEKAEKRVERLKNELDVTRRKLELAERKGKEPPRELIKVQDELRNLQLEHQTAMQQERQRAREVEDRAKKQTLVQEERIVNLEARLAELSESVGAYDRLRMNDQNEIEKLKNHLAAVSIADHYEPPKIDQEPIIKNSPEQVDLHKSCEEELRRVKEEYLAFKKQTNIRQETHGKSNEHDERISVLQNRIKNLSDELQLRRQSHQLEVEQLKQLLRAEKAQFKEALSAAETDHRSRINLLETQMQKLRERSLALLEEKEQEIHSLQSTFQAFLPSIAPSAIGMTSSQQPTELLPAQRGDGPRILHYANVLARRDVDIAALRRDKNRLETALRDLQRAAVHDAEMHRVERMNLREEIARLKRSQTREGANLEYLKNVVLSFLVSHDPNSKRHMCNAIAAVLKFSDTEIDKINKQQHNSWWSSSS